MARAAATLFPHHGSGMPNKGKGHNHLLSALLDQLAFSQRTKGSGKGGNAGISSPSNKYPPSWNCSCGYYNFEGRWACRSCKADFVQLGNRGQAAAKLRPEAGGKAQGRQQAAATKAPRVDKQTKPDGVADGDGDATDEIDEFGDVDPSVKADVAKLPELSKLLDDLVKAMGKDDPSAMALRTRVEAARAAQWSGKPVTQQLQRVQRRYDKVSQAVDKETANRDELLKQKTALEEKIKESERRSAELKLDQDRIRQELGDLHDRAKAERGCSAADAGGASATSTTGSPAADGCEANAAIVTLRALTGARISSEEQRAEADALFGAIGNFLGRLPVNPVGTAQPPALQQADGGTGAGAAQATAPCSGTAGETGQQAAVNAETPQAESYTLCSGGESEQEQEDVEMAQREGESPEDYCSRMQEKMAKRKAEREKGRQARRQRKSATASASPSMVATKGK